MAVASSGFNRNWGINGRTATPLGVAPVSRKRAVCSLLQPRGNPAIGLETATIPGGNLTQAKSGGTGAPSSQCARSGSPLASFGVWHSSHRATFSTRYRPRATASRSCAITLLAVDSRSVVATSNTKDLASLILCALVLIASRLGQDGRESHGQRDFVKRQARRRRAGMVWFATAQLNIRQHIGRQARPVG